MESTMSHDKIKAAARRRMAETGEPYATARREVIKEHRAARGRQDRFAVLPRAGAQHLVPPGEGQLAYLEPCRPGRLPGRCRAAVTPGGSALARGLRPQPGRVRRWPAKPDGPGGRCRRDAMTAAAG